MPVDQTLLKQVLSLAHEAGEQLAHFYKQKVQVQTKADNTPVTEADFAVSQFLSETLAALTPHLPVLSEENCAISFSERSTWQDYWLIDPLDGTQQFINRTDQFSVLITLVSKHQPILSVIHAPVLSETYYAIRGFGAFKQTTAGTEKLLGNKRDPQKPLRIVVGATTSQEKVRALFQKDIPHEFIVLGSSSLKSALVAQGLADCYVRLGSTGEWDTAGAEVLLGETNGAIFARGFKPLSYNQRETLINPHFIMVGDKSIDWASVFQFN